MKKILLASFILTLSLSVTNLFAQACTPDPIYVNEDAGVYPLPDSVGDPNSTLPTGCVNMPYESLFTAVVPATITTDLGGGPVTVPLTSVTVLSVDNLPPGTNYTCDPPDCIFLDETVGCVAITGTPTTQGTYSLIVNTEVNIGPVIPISFPGTLVSGEYKIFIKEEGNADCFVGVNDAFTNNLELGQNIPNPFSSITKIDISSKESGEFDFKVYSLIGEMVHAERVNLTTGENTVEFDASKLNSGVYFYALGQGSSIVTKRMIVSK